MFSAFKSRATCLLASSNAIVYAYTIIGVKMHQVLHIIKLIFITKNTTRLLV
jgi:hypothetical protein